MDFLIQSNGAALGAYTSISYDIDAAYFHKGGPAGRRVARAVFADGRFRYDGAFSAKDSVGNEYFRKLILLGNPGYSLYWNTEQDNVYQWENDPDGSISRQARHVDAELPPNVFMRLCGTGSETLAEFRARHGDKVKWSARRTADVPGAFELSWEAGKSHYAYRLDGNRGLLVTDLRSFEDGREVGRWSASLVEFEPGFWFPDRAELWSRGELSELVTITNVSRAPAVGEQHFTIEGVGLRDGVTAFIDRSAGRDESIVYHSAQWIPSEEHARLMDAQRRGIDPAPPRKANIPTAAVAPLPAVRPARAVDRLVYLWAGLGAVAAVVAAIGTVCWVQRNRRSS